MASDLLNAPRYAHVQARWQAMVSTRAAKIEITAEKVLQRVAMIAFGDVRQLARWRLEKEVVLRGRRFLEDGESQDEEEEQEQPPLVREVMRMRLIPSDELTDEAAAMIAEVKEAVYEYGSTVSVRPHNALEALKLLMRHLGLLKDRIQLEDFTAAGQEVAELLEDMAAAVSEQDEILRLAQAALNEPADKQPGKAREGQGETPA